MSSLSLPHFNARHLVPLAVHPLFEGVDPESCPDLRNLRRQILRPGRIVAGPHLPPTLVLVLAGRLHAFNLSSDGQRQILEVLGPGDVDGMLLQAGLGGHLCEAVTSSEVILIGSRQLEALIEEQPGIALNLYRAALHRLVRREAHMAALAEHVGCRALAKQLLALAQYAGERHGSRVLIKPRPTHQMLADMLGLRRETVTLNLLQLRGIGAVKLERSSLEIDPESLARVLKEDRYGISAADAGSGHSLKAS